jgi:hypothetical protein
LIRHRFARWIVRVGSQSRLVHKQGFPFHAKGYSILAPIWGASREILWDCVREPSRPRRLWPVPLLICRVWLVAYCLRPVAYCLAPASYDKTPIVRMAQIM